MLLPLLFLFSIATVLTAQGLPQVASGGTVNAASYAQPIVAGSIVSIFGSNLASTSQPAAETPLPPQIAGTSVTVNGITAPLLFVSPSQINLQVPWEVTGTSGAVIVTTAAGSSAPVFAPLSNGAPSLFSADGSGCGQALAQNVAAAGEVSSNSTSNSAAPGDYITLFGTGFGLPTATPADGAAPGVADRLSIEPGLAIDGNDVQGPLPYSGLAPTLPGVDQINFQIPAGTPEGCAVSLTPEAGGEFLGPTLSISVHSGRGQCVDPPVASYGTVTLTKTVTTAPDGSTTDSETLGASFPSGPGVQPPAPLAPTLPGSYEANVFLPATMSRSCAVNGDVELSAGTLTVNPASSSSLAIQASPTPTTGGVAYQASLPAGFLEAGTYSVFAGGSDAGPFQGVVTLPAPLQIQPFIQGAEIDQSQPLVIQWTGGTAGELVKVSLVVQSGPSQMYDYGVVDASAGSFTFTPICSGHSVESGGNGVVCTFGPPASDNVSVVVEAIPAPDSVTTASAPGISAGVQISYDYRYVFTGFRDD